MPVRGRELSSTSSPAPEPFEQIRATPTDSILSRLANPGLILPIHNREIERRVGAARFRSETLRLYKLPELEERCEDHGQVATYRGKIPGHESLFGLDDHHLFEAGRPERVCGNTAAMLSETRFARWFDVQGDRSQHFGEFSCDATLAQQQREESGTDSTTACC